MDANQLILIAVAVGVGFFAQGLVGFAASLIAFPILLQVFTFQEATAFLSFYFVVFSVYMVYKNHAMIDKKIVKNFIITVTLGFLAGVYLLKSLDSALLQKLLGAFLVLYVLQTLFLKKKINWPDKFNWVAGLLGGAAAGIFLSGGQVFGTFLDNKLSSAAEVRATLIGVLAIGNFLRFPSLIATHLLTWDLFKLSIIFFPMFLVGMLVGQKLFSRLNDKALRFLILLFLIISGFK